LHGTPHGKIRLHPHCRKHSGGRSGAQQGFVPYDFDR
jgi:hypothetical protein